MALAYLKKFIQETKGDAVVEATILFPIMIMIMAALVLLAIFLPVRATLQRATQYAATAIASEQSDTWLYYDENTMSYGWKEKKGDLNNVYVALIKSISFKSDEKKAEIIVRNVEESGISTRAGNLTVEFGVVNYIVYKEVVVTAKRTIPVPVDLSFIGFPKEIPIVVTSTAVVQNGDEFVRNMDIAVDFVEYIDGKYNISDAFKSVKELSDTFKSVLGWK